MVATMPDLLRPELSQVHSDTPAPHETHSNNPKPAGMTVMDVEKLPHARPSSAEARFASRSPKINPAPHATTSA